MREVLLTTMLELAANPRPDPQGLCGSNADIHLLWQLRKEIRPFLITPEGPITVASCPEPAGPISLPFPVCYFEMLGEEALLVYERPGVGKIFDFYALVVMEVSPQQYRAWYVCRAHQLGDGKRLHLVAANPNEWSDLANFGVHKLLAYLLNRIRTGSLGSETTAIRVKARVGNTKEFHKIRQVIRVVPKNKTKGVRPVFGSIIDWSHRWEVMGHWRRTGGVGKSRTGEYVINGMTWVNPHTKGPDAAPMVTKTRVVTNNKGEKTHEQ